MTITLDDGYRYHFPRDEDVIRVSVSWPVGDDGAGMAYELRRRTLLDAVPRLPQGARCIGTQTITTPHAVTEWQVFARAGTYTLLNNTTPAGEGSA